MSETIAGSSSNIGAVNPFNGLLTKAVDVGLERYSMQTQNKRIIASTQSDGTPPDKMIADDNISKERNTANIADRTDDRSMLSKVPKGVAIGGGILLVSLIALIVLTKKGR